MKILIGLVGLPRSGKSTWARKQNVPIVNPDSIRLALHGQNFFGPAEPLVWAMAELMVRALFNAGHDFVILDATNTTHKRRRVWSLTQDWQVRWKLFDAGQEVCINRAVLEDNRPDLVEVIERMHQQFEKLMPTEALWWKETVP